MCSVFYTNKVINDLESINYLNQKRGPDYTNKIEINGFTYIHNLLSITGEFTIQPFIKDDVILLYNGEIYNYKNFGDYKSDGECIIDLYLKEGTDSFKFLDGEYAIIIEDKRSNSLFLATDTFGTKPLYLAINEKKIGVSSYPKPLELMSFTNIKRLKPNTVTKINLYDFKIVDEKTIYNFDLTQNINSYDEWSGNFINAVKKRTDTNLDVLVPLSSGYDSGGICCALNSLNRDYISFTIKGRENLQILKERFNQNKNTKKEMIESFRGINLEEIINEMKTNVQKFYYGPNFDEFTHDGFDDQGAQGLYFILKAMRKKYNVKVILSGQGSDEIMTNIQTYGFKTKNPAFFDENIKEIFPWGNFYYGSQWSYLMKEECIGGSLGMETRYPFLDKTLVQSYLNLTPELKNKKYKAPLNYFLSERGYPFKEEKIGFQIF